MQSLRSEVIGFLFDIEKRVARIDSSPKFAPFTRIVIKRSDKDAFTAGDDSGRTLTVVCPWGTQRIADGLLLQIRGYAYQPFEAMGAIISPAAELGDGIQVNGLESRIYSQTITFGPLFISDISAPDGEEIDHEYPYYSSQERKSQREIAGVKAAQSNQYSELAGRILALETLLNNVSKKTASVASPDGSTLAVNYLGWEDIDNG